MATVDWSEPSTGLLHHIQTLDRKFRQSCKQILLINNEIEDLQVRYDRAMKRNRRSFRYSLRLRLATLEGVRNMFYEYASRCASNLEELQNRLFDIGGREGLEDVSEEWAPVVSSDDEVDEHNAEDDEEETSLDNIIVAESAQSYSSDSAYHNIGPTDPANRDNAAHSQSLRPGSSIPVSFASFNPSASTLNVIRGSTEPVYDETSDSLLVSAEEEVISSEENNSDVELSNPPSDLAHVDNTQVKNETNFQGNLEIKIENTSSSTSYLVP